MAKDHLSPPANGPKTNARHLTVPPVEVCLVARLHAPLSSSWCNSCGLFSNVLSFCFHVNSPPIRDSKETLSSPLQCNFRQCIECEGDDKTHLGGEGQAHLFFVLCSYLGRSLDQADACHMASVHLGFCSIWNTHFCLRLQPHLYPVPVATSVGRSDGTRQRYKSTHV